jgi:hypothetical protein
MKHLLLTLVFLLSINLSTAQSPKGKSTGVGVVLGDPTGATLKYWTGNMEAYNFYIGNSYFGELTVGVDYMQHYNAFNSSVFNVHLAGGVVAGLGNGNSGWIRKGKDDGFYYRDGKTFGVGARGMLGLNFVPKSSPFEISLEVGPFLGISPAYGFDFMSDLTIRFYP